MKKYSSLLLTFFFFILSSSSLICHLDVFQKDMTSDTNKHRKHKQLLSVQTLLLSSSTQSLVSSSLSLSFSVCLSVLLVEGSGNHMVELLVWAETNDTYCETQNQKDSHAQDSFVHVWEDFEALFCLQNKVY